MCLLGICFLFFFLSLKLNTTLGKKNCHSLSSFYTPCMVLSSSFSCRAILYWSGPIWKILSSLTLFESCQVPVKSGTFLKAIGSVFVPWTYQCTTGNPVQTMDEGILMTNTSVQMSTADGYRRKQSPKHLRGCLL